ncbi:DEAD/DEAH box helicase [Leptospira alstonii]|uniref:SNF2 family N-terminal domain protein n=2 Tax=Leptospira alstonii TaxID=28452 RepID=M6D3C2_9LEPT|nr:DEAD/DEAH box helicase [Leptospira alstonii]EMJ95723.1 SNF2 family N-terminal domain protein [Leptospira alstonii serovar Sichuan str. 79601]EQA80707.1 DEAD/DEAH box helicase [Leptospira alstonii serovar Pingchang str. 80-412]
MKQLQLAVFLMPDGHFCEFAGITANGRVYPFLQLYRENPNPDKFQNLFPQGQQEASLRVLFYSSMGRSRIINLRENMILNSCEPKIRIYTNDGRSAYFAGRISYDLRLFKNEDGLYGLAREKDAVVENTWVERYIWENPSQNEIPDIISVSDDEPLPVLFDGPSQEQRRMLNRLGGREWIRPTDLVKYKNSLKLNGVKGLELIPEVYQAGPALCIFLEPFYNESEELGINGRICFVYAKRKNDLFPLKRKKQSDHTEERPSEKEQSLYEFTIKQHWASVRNAVTYSEHPSGVVIKRSVKKENALYSLELPLRYSGSTGEFKIPPKKVSSFFTEILPEILKKNVILKLHPDLDGITIRRKASFQIRESSGVDWFGGGIQVDGLDSMESSAVYAAWKAGRKFVRLQKLGMIDLKNLAFESLDKTLDSAGIELDKNGNSSRLNKGQVMALDLDGDLRVAKSFQKLKNSLKNAFENNNIQEQFSPGPDFRGELRDYQKKGAQFLFNLHSLKIGGILADEMGLGKTIQCLAFFSKIFKDSSKTKILVIAPLAAIGVWEEECARFLPDISVQVWHGSSRKESKLARTGIIITTYQTLTRDMEIFNKLKFATMVLDEAQNVKNAATDSARSVRKIKAGSVFCLTGTPMENHLDEFWSLFDLSFPGLLGNLRSFQRNFSPANIQELQKRTEKFLLRRRKSEVLTDLPPKTEIRVSTPMEIRQAKLYEKARQEAILTLKSAGSNYIFELLPQLTRLRRLACHPDIGMDKVDPKQSGKINRFLTMIREEIPEGSATLVFSQFTDTLSIVKNALDLLKIEYFYLDGKTPQSKRVSYVKRFQRGERRFFLISLKAGGVSLTLTRADTVFHLDPWWNPAVENQASDRAHRFGQKQPVFIYKLFSEGSIEERVLELQEKKRRLFASLLDSEKGWTESNISREELRELIG